MLLKDLAKMAIEVRDRYDDIAKKHNEPAWGLMERTAGIATDLGELMEYVMVHLGYRAGENNTEKLMHEIGDIFYALCAICDYTKIDPVESFKKALDDMNKRLDSVEK
jgi:uncharacterized protein YabN with tetrapyrrole methylase and pyrophosphatase domain